MAPSISVVIPAHNEERYLEACLQSLKNQDFSGSFEVIVVDNCSDDNTASIAAKLDARVVFESKRGVCMARQAGTVAALGDIVISTDADTVFPHDWLRRIWAGFQQGPDVVAVAGAVEYTNAPWWGKLYGKALFGSTNLRYRRSGKVGYISACNTAFRKSAWTGYNTRLTQGGDEFGLLSQFKGKGRIIFQRNNVVHTSSRRMHKGLLYNIFVTIALYYGLDYLIGKFTGKSVLGSYQPIRQERFHMSRKARFVQGFMAIIVVVFSYTFVVAHNAMAARAAHVTGARLDNVTDTIGAIPVVKVATTNLTTVTNHVMDTPIIRTTRQHVSSLARKIHLKRRTQKVSER